MYEEKEIDRQKQNLRSQILRSRRHLKSMHKASKEEINKVIYKILKEYKDKDRLTVDQMLEVIDDLWRSYDWKSFMEQFSHKL